MRILNRTLGLLGLVGVLVASPFLTGCESKDDKTNSETPSTPTSTVTRTSNDYPTFSASDFVIDYPRNGERNVEYRTYMSGKGLQRGSTLRVVVHTNHDYDQVGTTEINADGDWNYSPLYIGGLADTIQVQAFLPDGTEADRTITDVGY